MKPGGFVYIAVPGMKDDGLHEDLPAELLLSWTPEELSALHDAAYWQTLVNQAQDADVVSVHEMDVNEEAWNDWLACDNEYSVNDRASLDAGGRRLFEFRRHRSEETLARLPASHEDGARFATARRPLRPSFATVVAFLRNGRWPSLVPARLRGRLLWCRLPHMHKQTRDKCFSLCL